MEGCQVSEGAVTKRDKYTREYTNFDVAHNCACPGCDEKRGRQPGWKGVRCRNGRDERELVLSKNRKGGRDGLEREVKGKAKEFFFFCL
jgi:hypothetical protein